MSSMARWRRRCDAAAAASAIALSGARCGAADKPLAPPTNGSRVLWSLASVTVAGTQPALDGHAVYSLGFGHYLAAVDRQSHRVLWRDTLPVTGPFTGGYNVVLAGGRAIVGDSNVYAVDTLTGRLVWSFVPPGGTQPGASYLAVANGVVYTGSVSNHVYAIEAATGRLVWDATVSAHPSDTHVFGPQVVDGVVYTAYTDRGEPWLQAGRVVALNAATGAVVWSSVLPSHPPSPTGSTFVVAPPTVSGSVVVAGTDEGYIYALSRTDGTILWNIPPTPPSPGNTNNVPTGDIRPLVAVGSTVYAGSGTGWVVAIDVPSGRARWTVLPEQYYGTAAWLTADAQSVYVVHPYGQMTALNATDGSVRWQIGTKIAPALGAPVIGQDAVYFGGIDGLYAAAP